MKRPITLVLLTLLMGLAAACGGGDEEADDSRRSVVTAFYPLTYIASAVAGDEADVSSVTPAGVEPHDIELTAAQVRRVSEADLLVYIGQGFQPALDKLVPEVANTLDVLTVRPPGSRAKDPHIWLDPILMAGITDTVADALSKVDAANAKTYRKNADALILEINDLDDDFSNGLSRCDRRKIVTTHEAFGHMADRFNLEQVGIAGIDPEQEPSARRLDEVAKIVEAEDITTIFFEALLPEDLAETVAEETGAETAVLDPLESPPKTGDYVSAMRANLAALRTAMGCR
ncbi:MAG TPA: metal ABC transporter substrate-binding protein [Actinomycetota bacterium]|nr:metal ABC transporter substrate-binding protein [Actinomycetota bacterium]